MKYSYAVTSKNVTLMSMKAKSLLQGKSYEVSVRLVLQTCPFESPLDIYSDINRSVLTTKVIERFLLTCDRTEDELIRNEIATQEQGSTAWKQSRLFVVTSTEFHETCKNKRTSFEK